MHLFAMPLLGGDAFEVDPVGAERQVDGRGGERNQPAASGRPRAGRGGRRARADEVARRRPQEVALPDPPHRLVRREPDGGGDDAGVEQVVDERGRDERFEPRQRVEACRPGRRAT